MSCALCGAELREDERLGLVGPDGRASCRLGGPHRLLAEPLTSEAIWAAIDPAP